jgi:signal transduction histidine kinase
MHRALIDVSARQMESLRVGVSSILVTLARRNSSLVDRQLALLDELEAREDDPETLGGFYQVDHLAARMRRNAESLLVLAGSDSPRVWAKPTDISDVVRAALSEVDEYQRVELLALEPARLYGGAVTDVAHLLAELFENSVQFSPPTEPVRVTGLFDVDGYELSITDRGVGMPDPRLAELNRILERPPALGLSVEPTMGMYVVAKLAHRHGLAVQLVRSVPGITVKVTIPRDRLETASVPEPSEAGIEVIDLTKPEMLEPIAVATPASDEDLADLPIRVPGQAFNEEDPSPGVVAGEGGGSLRSALIDYNRGRTEAGEIGDAGV